MKPLLALFIPAYGVTLIAVPVTMLLDQLGRGAAPLAALAVLPIWALYTALLALLFILPAALVAVLLQRLGGGAWAGRAGRPWFALVCAGLGAAIMALTVHGHVIVAAAAGGTAGWVAHAPAWTPHRRRVLIIAVGLTAGIVQGLHYF